MKQRSISLILALLLLLCGGCQDQQESDTLTVVAGVAVDGEQGNYRLTTETVVAGGQQEGGLSQLVDSRGTTLAGGLINAMNLTAKTLYFTHAQVLVVSAQVARESLKGLLEALERESNFRFSIRIVVAENDASSLLSIQTEGQEATSFTLRSMTATSGQNGGSPDTPMYRFLDDIGEPGIEGVLPLAGMGESQGKPALKIAGTALFRDEVLVGALDARQSQALLWMRTARNGGVIEEGDTSLKILNCKRTLDCTQTGAVIRLKLRLQEQEGHESGEALRRFAEERVQHRCQEVLEQLKTLGCDAVGLGQALLRTDPSLTEEIEKNWPQRFVDYPVRVEVSVEIRDAGRMKKGADV